MDQNSTNIPIKFYHAYHNEDGSPAQYGELSNFYVATINIDGKEWPSTEHYFQGIKFAGVDEEYLEKVRTSSSPGESKRLARLDTVKRRDDWNQVKYEVMKTALRAKFTQHEDLKKILLETGDRELIEDSAEDYQWGCGKDGTGQNLLGKALVEIRAEIRNK